MASTTSAAGITTDRSQLRAAVSGSLPPAAGEGFPAAVGANADGAGAADGLSDGVGWAAGRIVTVKLPLAVLPAASVALQSTVVTPSGKVLPEGGAHVGAMGPSTG